MSLFGCPSAQALAKSALWVHRIERSRVPCERCSCIRWGGLWGKSRRLNVARLDLGAEEEGHELVGEAQGAAEGGAGRARGASPRFPVVVGVPLAPSSMQSARVPHDVGANPAVALARDEVPHALAEPGVEVLPRELKGGVVGMVAAAAAISSGVGA
jgi:hypothetical protein